MQTGLMLAVKRLSRSVDQLAFFVLSVVAGLRADGRHTDRLYSYRKAEVRHTFCGIEGNRGVCIQV